MKITCTTRRKSTLDIFDIVFCETRIRSEAILAASKSREITRDMVRVKSSNVWGYNIDVRGNGNVGDVYVQFKGAKGGPGDIYVYYDVPVRIYRKWHTAPSKGHFFWQYIRNNYKYSKLTGDKKTHLKNGVRYRPRVETPEEPEEVA